MGFGTSGFILFWIIIRLIRYHQISSDISAIMSHKCHSWWLQPPLFGDSNRALQVSSLAESEGHHPDLHLTNYRNVQAAMPKIFEIG